MVRVRLRVRVIDAHTFVDAALVIGCAAFVITPVQISDSVVTPAASLGQSRRGREDTRTWCRRCVCVCVCVCVRERERERGEG